MTPSNPKSVYDDAWIEANKHKWIESEKKGHDLGFHAIDDWLNKHWKKFYRACHLEHLFGKQKWTEFAEYQFGRLCDFFHNGNDLLHFLIEKIAEGWENLELMDWMHKTSKSREEINHVLHLLEIIDVNNARLEPRLQP